jgi:hypothetical protein
MYGGRFGIMDLKKWINERTRRGKNEAGKERGFDWDWDQLNRKR